MQEITDLERRITSALARIDAGLLDTAVSPAAAGADEANAHATENSRLTAALEDMQIMNAQLEARLLDNNIRETEIRSSIESSLAEAQAELAVLRTARATEAAEIAEIVTALTPFVSEALSNARN